MSKRSENNHLVFYVGSAERAAWQAKLDEIARHRGYIARAGRNTGEPDRSAVVRSLVDEELARMAIEKAQGVAPVQQVEELQSSLDAARKRPLPRLFRRRQ